jgi:hypothetical protein
MILHFHFKMKGLRFALLFGLIGRTFRSVCVVSEIYANSTFEDLQANANESLLSATNPKPVDRSLPAQFEREEQFIQIHGGFRSAPLVTPGAAQVETLQSEPLDFSSRQRRDAITPLPSRCCLGVLAAKGRYQARRIARRFLHRPDPGRRPRSGGND